MFSVDSFREGFSRHSTSLFYIFKVGFFYFLPFWVTLFMMYLSGQWQNFHSLFDGGTLFIYSAALLSEANELTSGFDSKKLTFIGFVRILSWILIIMSAVGFALTNIPGALSSTFPLVSTSVAHSSTSMVIAALIILYYSHYTCNSLSNASPEAANDRSIQDLISRLP